MTTSPLVDPCARWHNRRRDIYRKMSAESAVDLVRMVIEADGKDFEP